jgi:hypothetical protein
VALLVFWLGSAGCHLIFPFDVPPLPTDGSLDREGPGSDLGEADSPSDSMVVPDSTVDWWSCPLDAKNDHAVLLLRFDGSGGTVEDAVDSAQHIATLVETGITRTSGPAGCGNALAFTKTSPVSYLRVDAHEDWKLEVGSLDLWVRFDGPPPSSQDVAGIISRDASGIGDGHLTMYRRCDGVIAVRYQYGGLDYYRCSEDNIPQDEWHHVGVNFGGEKDLELFVNGQLADRTDQLGGCIGSSPTCGATISAGIADTDNAWVIGAANWQSADGTLDNVVHPFRGSVDEVRLSSIRRDFSALPTAP